MLILSIENLAPGFHDLRRYRRASALATVSIDDERLPAATPCLQRSRWIAYAGPVERMARSPVARWRHDDLERFGPIRNRASSAK